MSSVSSDNYLGGRLVADLLVGAGRRRIAFISGEANTSSGRDRGLGLKDRLAELGMTIYAQGSGEYRYAEAAEAARHLLSLTPPPDALFCANDVMAVASLAVARDEFGLRVPEDLSIVGFDNLDGPIDAAFQLTTVEQHVDEMARRTVSLMLATIAGVTAEIEHIVVPVTPVLRKTH